jgi:hypothetical protein
MTRPEDNLVPVGFRAGVVVVEAQRGARCEQDRKRTPQRNGGSDYDRAAVD